MYTLSVHILSMYECLLQAYIRVHLHEKIYTIINRKEKFIAEINHRIINVLNSFLYV